MIPSAFRSRLPDVVRATTRPASLSSSTMVPFCQFSKANAALATSLAVAAALEMRVSSVEPVEGDQSQTSLLALMKKVRRTVVPAAGPLVSRTGT